MHLVLALGLLAGGAALSPLAPAAVAAASDGVDPAAPEESTTPTLLAEAVARGEIDQATADLHLAQVFGGPDTSAQVPHRFLSDSPWDGTSPLLALSERMSSSPAGPTLAKTQAALAATECSDSTLTLANEATSDHFYLGYDTIGSGLSAKGYLASLEASYEKQVITFGWPAPPARQPAPPEPIGRRYVVRLGTLTGGLYGFVAPSGTGAGVVGDNPNTSWDDVDALATCMVLARDYGPYRGTAQQALNATTAHEFNHSIQYGYGAYGGGNVPDDTFFEGGASWMEDEVFDDSNDNYGYLWPDFRDSLGDYDGTRPGTGEPYHFPMWVVLRGLTERFGTGVADGGEQVMQDFWETTSRNVGNNVEALDIALQNKGVTLRDAYHDFAIGAGFMKTCGGQYTLPHCFEEAEGYVAAAGGLPPVAGSIGSVGGTFNGAVEDDYALNWVTLPASSTFSLTLANTAEGGQLRATAVCDTGTTLIRTALPQVAGAGGTTSLPNLSTMGCVRTLAVITNQQQSPGNPGASRQRTFTLTTGAPGPNGPPAGNDDRYTTFEGAPLTIAAPGVLANDVDPNGNVVTATLPSAQTNGTATVNANGAFTFTPTAGFTGTASFSYTANDGVGGTDLATVTITVTPRPTYAPLTPARLMDTRAGGTTIDGISAGSGAIAPGTSRILQVTGRGGVPTTPVAAVALNVTAAAPTAGGFLTVFPAGESRPNASNLNFGPGLTVPNLVIAKVGAGGQVSIFNETGSTHVIVDLAGWFPVNPGFTPLSPGRILDTRTGGSTVDGVSAGGGAIGPGATRVVQATGRAGVPTAGVSAVVLNITAAAPSGGGFFTVFPTGEGRPNASNLNFVPNQTSPNLVVAKVGAGGQVSIFNETGSTQVIADVSGWFPTGSSYTALSPARLLDTRTGGSTIDGASAGGGAIGPGVTRVLPVTGRGGVPPSGVGAVVLNVTATSASVGGFFTVFPTGEAQPNTSNLNFVAGQTIPNLVIAKVGAGGRVSIFNAGGSTQVIADVAGWLPAV